MIRRWFNYFFGNASIRRRLSSSIFFAFVQQSASKIFLFSMIPNIRDKISIECKSSAVALNDFRISTKSFWIIDIFSGFMSNSLSRNSVKNIRNNCNFGLINCLTAVNVSFINLTESTSGFIGMWQLLCLQDKNILIGFFVCYRHVDDEWERYKLLTGNMLFPSLSNNTGTFEL